ncbi:Protein bcp1 [Coccomyxa sp. Obi]|nr:Protein bcp1 [Coccomyxa sp. Obi]
MAGRNAKRKSTANPELGDEDEISPSTSESSDGFGSESDKEKDPEDDDIVNIDFEFFDPAEIDFHGLKSLLRTFLDGEDFSCSELVDTIIKQSTVGTTVKTSEEDDPIGVITALNIQRYHKLSCLKEVCQFLLKQCQDEQLKAKLQEVWDQAGTGLIVSERLINCPPQLASPLQHALFDEEIPWATEDEPSEELRNSYKFERFLFISRVYQDTMGPPQPGGHGKKQKGGRQPPTMVYARPEDEFYHRHSTWSYSFPVTSRPVQKDELQPLRLVMLLTPDQAATARKELYRVVGNAALGQEAAGASQA